MRAHVSAVEGVSAVFICISWVLKRGREGAGMGCREEGGPDCSFEGLIQSPVEEKSMEAYSKLRAQPEFVIGVPLGDGKGAR